MLPKIPPAQRDLSWWCQLLPFDHDDYLLSLEKVQVRWWRDRKDGPGETPDRLFRVLWDLVQL